MARSVLFLVWLVSSSAKALGASSSPAEDWQFVISPLYVWGKSIEGVSAIGANETPLDLDFQDDILENLDATFTLRVEAGKDRFAYYVEYNYGQLDPSSSGSLGPVQLNADVTYDDIMAEAGILWTFSGSNRNLWELLGGRDRKY